MNIVDRIKKFGFAQVNNVFSKNEISLIKLQLDQYLNNNHEGVVREEDGTTLRAIHGLHLYNSFFSQLVTDSRLLKTAEKHLNVPLYVHQTKINVKAKKNGQKWPWHQDYVYWLKEDGLLKPNLINVIILLDDAIPENGPLCLIPYSHTHGELSDIEITKDDGWMGNVSANLTYQISHDKAKDLSDKYGTSSFVGKAGSVLFFDPRVVHCSDSNTSDQDRNIFIVTYNDVNNLPVINNESLRPDFLCSRDNTALKHKEFISLENCFNN